MLNCLHSIIDGNHKEKIRGHMDRLKRKIAIKAYLEFLPEKGNSFPEKLKRRHYPKIVASHYITNVNGVDFEFGFMSITEEMELKDGKIKGFVTETDLDMKFLPFWRERGFFTGNETIEEIEEKVFDIIKKAKDVREVYSYPKTLEQETYFKNMKPPTTLYYNDFDESDCMTFYH